MYSKTIGSIVAILLQIYPSTFNISSAGSYFKYIIWTVIKQIKGTIDKLYAKKRDGWQVWCQEKRQLTSFMPRKKTDDKFECQQWHCISLMSGKETINKFYVKKRDSWQVLCQEKRQLTTSFMPRKETLACFMSRKETVDKIEC